MSAQIETFLWCFQNEYFSKTVTGSKGDEYLVEYGTRISGPYSANWHCTCPGFKFRDTCKHVNAAETERCDYGFEAVMGSPAHDWDDGNCPKCGSKATSVKVAV